MDAKLLLQQCKMYQNKNREVVFIPYANVYNFYRSLDEYVINGRRINITFPLQKITHDSFLMERIMSCENGYEFLEQLLEPNILSLGLIEKKSIVKISQRLNYIKCDKTLYYSYQVSYIYDEDYQQSFLHLAPKGEGLKSQSFQIDLEDLD
jgi:hypothetical protein